VKQTYRHRSNDAIDHSEGVSSVSFVHSGAELDILSIMLHTRNSTAWAAGNGQCLNVKVRLLIQNESQQALFNLHIAVVFDQAQLPKLVQEYVHAAPRGSITGNCRISRHRPLWSSCGNGTEK